MADACVRLGGEGRVTTPNLLLLQGMNCGTHDSPITVFKSGKAFCEVGCETKEIIEFARSLNGSLNGHRPQKEEPPVDEAGGGYGGINERPQYANGHDTTQALTVWKAKLFETAEALLRKDVDLIKLTGDLQFEALRSDLVRSMQFHDNAPAFLTKTEALEEIELVTRLAIGEVEPVKQNGGPPAKSKYAIGVGAPAVSSLRVYGAEEYFEATDYLDQIEWCWDEIFPSAGLIGVFGDPEAGKSTFCRTFALAVSRGEECLGRATRQSKVLYLDLADEQLSHRRAFKALGWSGKEMQLVSQDSLIGNPNALDLAEAAIKAVGAKVVVVDMMADLLTFRDLNDYANAKEALRGLRMLCRETSALFVVLHHTPKALGPDADVLKAGLGSQAIVGSFDLRIAIRRRAKDLSTIIMSNGKVGGKPLTTEYSLIRDSNTEWISLGSAWESARKDYYADRIHDYFKLQGPEEKMTAAQIAETLDLNPGFIRASLRTLIRDGRLTRDGEGKPRKPFYYRLPDWVPPEKDSRYKDD